MNIIHLLSQNHLTGSEVYAATLTDAQTKKGHQVYQVSNGFFYETKAECHPLEVETKSRLRFIKNVFWLRRFLKQKQIHVIHTHSRAAAKLAYWARSGLNVGIVSSVHGQQHSSVSKKLFNQYGDFLIAVCENIKRHLVSDFKYEPRRIRVIRNAIDDVAFAYAPRTHGPYVKIAIIGRTTGPKKERTQQVVNALFRTNLAYQITLVGGHVDDLQLSQELKSKMTEVHIPSLTSADYRQYDLVIGAGRVCMEALFSGVPTIAFGEADYVGLIRVENLSAALLSNFGDINLKSHGPILNLAQFKHDLGSSIKSDELQVLSARARAEFSLSSVSKKIERLYESAYFIRNYSNWIPTLMYHKIPAETIESRHRIFVTKKNFEKHLRFYRARGFKTLTFTDLAKYRTGEKPFSEFPRKPLILTFDDGYRDNLENASPLLQKYKFRAQLFLLANKDIQDNEWDFDASEAPHQIVSGEERKHWLESAFEIGSHGFNHEKITKMNDAQAYSELHDSKVSLENELGIKVNCFAFTYGDTTLRASELALDAGYDYAVNTDTGGLLMEESPYQIFRVNIFPEDSKWTLWKKTSAWYRNYYFRKRKK